MTDSSDCESDAGASPSVSSDESSSSRCSSPTALKIVTPGVQQITPKRKASNAANNSPATGGTGSSSATASIHGTSLSITPGTSATPGTSFSVTPGTPLSAGRKPVRRRQICSSPVASTSAAAAASIAISVVRPRTSKEAQTDNKTPVSTNSSPNQRKRRHQSSKASSSPEHSDHASNHEHGDDPISSPEKKRKRNKRRRTRSERNLLAGKTTTSPGKTPVVTEVEEAVALDAEIDRVLEEKAIKNNLSATNVKSIIRHVITNNMVQKMIMSAVRKKAESGGGDAGRSSDEDGLLEPKMTRAKTKELMGNNQISLWPIVDSPVKSKKPVSETHMLIHNDLPEDSSGDEEYVPKEADISEIAHSEDESSSIASSHTSDVGSPVAPYKQGVTTRRSMQADRSPFTDSMFKTPPPRPNAKSLKKNREDSAISRRTRSKLPLNDTPLEDLERQLVAPDITKDMYDWGTETDNEDYLAFLKDFLNPGKNQTDANEMDDDADPEYNVMEDVEDLHDREELRMDRAVKVPKKELTQLIAELFESGGILSGDDIEDDLAALTGITPLANDSGFTDSTARLADTSLNSTAQDIPNSTVDTSAIEDTDGKLPSAQAQEGSLPVLESGANFITQAIINEVNESLSQSDPTQVTVLKTDTDAVIESSDQPPPGEDETNEAQEICSPPYFEEADLNLLKHQMRQHIQLLAQSYVLTVSSEDAHLKNIAKTAKTMVVELKNFSRMNGTNSNFSVCNLESAWTLVNFWPHKFISQSPIKKKILEEKYISESGITINGEGKQKGNYFPRHVVKVIAENNAFLYNSLLPLCYNQKSDQSRCRFSYHEDALIVKSLEELDIFKLSTAKLAEIISEVLLVVHPPSQLYHRIRNLRKSGTYQYCHPDIKKYFTDKILPESDRTVPELNETNILPLLQRDKRDLSSLWTALLLHIEDSPRDKWEEKMSKDPVTKNTGRKWNASKSRKKVTGTSSAASKPFSQSDTINRVFPNGTLIVDTPNPHMTTIPVIGANGRVGALIKIPKLALVVPPTPQQPKEGERAERSPTITQSIFARPQPPQPLEAQEARGTAEICSQQQSASNINLLGLQHLTARAYKTPVKQTPTIISSEEDSPPDKNKATEFKAPILPPQPSVPIMVTAANFSVVHVVGKPFDLPPELKGSSCEIINLSSLQTPMKKKIFEKVAEQDEPQQSVDHDEEQRKEEVLSPCDTTNESEVPDSPNVILEGTEVELTSDEEDDEGEWLRCNEQPEMITLSSDEDEKIVDSKDIPNDGNNGGSTGNGGGSNTSPKKSDSGGGNSSKQGSSGTVASTNTINSSVSKKSVGSSLRSTGGSGGKGDDSDDDGDRKNCGNNNKRPLPKDYVGDDDHQEKDKNKRHQPTAMQAPPPPTGHHAQSLSSPSQQYNQQGPGHTSAPTVAIVNSSSKQQKKARSPGGPTGNKSKVSSKYNVTPADKMLEETPNEFEDVADAYMEAYLARVQTVTEATHPGIYGSFVQMLMDAGESATLNQSELHAKVKVLFKDYPDLLKEFESFLDPSFNEVASTQQDSMTEINLVQMVEKYTENCPALKAKIMNKLKSLKEKPNLTEKDMASALEPFFSVNPVMMEAFKAILPSVYRPQSVSSGMDFEVIELDMEDPPQQRGGDPSGNNEDLHFEIVKLPDETRVPATNTCPCICHTKTSDPAFASRSKHCRKCSLKDGKIFIHNGKGMRPVSVELTPAVTANKHH